MNVYMSRDRLLCDLNSDADMQKVPTTGSGNTIRLHKGGILLNFYKLEFYDDCGNTSVDFSERVTISLISCNCHNLGQPNST